MTSGKNRRKHINHIRKPLWKEIMIAVGGTLLLFGVLSLVLYLLGTPVDSSNTSNHLQNLHIVRENLPNKSEVIRKDYEGFTVGFLPEFGVPRWVGWELLGSETEGQESRKNKFWQDKDLKGCPESRDYKNTGYDRGHMCPAADQKWSPLAMSDCFSMANICPQEHSLNTKAWATLENKERLWARRDSAIIIVAGPVFDNADKNCIADGRIRVPSAFFKVLLAPYLPQPRAIGFIYPNRYCPGNMADYAMSVDEVERITGLDFFYNLPDEMENELESNYSFYLWNQASLNTL